MVAKNTVNDCRFCRQGPTVVVRTDVRSDGAWVRYRRCRECKATYMTIETLGPVASVIPLARRLKEIEAHLTTAVRLAAEAEFYLAPEERDPEPNG